jgi:cytochrome c-type biogenesis protein CcmH/NrfF
MTRFVILENLFSCRSVLSFVASILALLLISGACGQTPQIESDDVNRVGSHIACQCGCKESVSCPMSKRGCSFCVPAKARIFKMQQAGMSDAAIVDVYKREFGEKIYLSDPTMFYWSVPAFATLLGLLAVYWFIRRFKSDPHMQFAGPVDPTLTRFQEEIERETANLGWFDSKAQKQRGAPLESRGEVHEDCQNIR